MTDATHDPNLRSWVESANVAAADFPIQNLPLGVFRRRRTGDAPGIGVAIGDQILDLRVARTLGLFEGLPSAIADAATSSTLNALMAAGHVEMTGLRRLLITILDANGRRAEQRSLVAMDQAE